MQPQQTVVVTQSSGPYDTGTAYALSIGFACGGLLLTGVGIHGVHRCYMNDVGLGILQGLTCGGCWIWTLVDWCIMQQLVDDANNRSRPHTVIISG